jgi:hypothetical protein
MRLWGHRFLLLLGVVTFGLGFTGCDDDDDDNPTDPGGTPETALVRVAHLSPDAGTVTVIINEGEADELSLPGVEFGDFSNYLEVPAVAAGTDYTVKVRTAGGADAIDTMVTVVAGDIATIAAVGPAASIAAEVYPENPAASASVARLNFVHAAEPVGDVDVTLTDGSALFSGVAFRDRASNTLEVPGGSYDLQVRAAGTNTVALSFDDVAVQSGVVYTVWAVELPSGEITALVSVDDTGAATTTVLTLDPAVVDLRVAHFSPDAPGVDVYLDGALVDALVNVPYEAVSSFLEVSAATHQIEVYAHGADPAAADPVIDETVTLLPGVQYTVAATGFLGDIGATIVTYEGDLPDSGNALVRFVHASPDAPTVDIVVDSVDPELTLFDDVSFGDPATAFQSVGAGSYDLEARIASSGDVALDLNGVAFEDGGIVTIFAIGSVGSVDTPLGVVVASEAPAPAVNP